MEIDCYLGAAELRMISSSADFISKGANRKVRKLLGRAYLRENRISEALEVYLGILKDYPGDPDVMIVLGNLYRLSGSPSTAENLYRRVLDGNPEDHLAEKQALKAREQTYREWETGDPLSAEAVECLVSRLQAKKSADQVEEIRASAEILERVIPENPAVESNGNGKLSDQPVQLPGQHEQLPEDVQQLMPALIAQNIRQARVAGYAELAEALQSLQINLARQVEDRWADDLLKDEFPVEKNSEE
jgi:tetratricopeptide (TPR) repeat protein